MSPFSELQPWKRFFFFEHLIRPHLSRPKTSIQQSIPSPAEGPRSGFWKRQSHRMAPGTGPGTSSDTHISYYAVRAFLFSTHYLVNVDTAGVYQKMLLYVVKHIIVIKNWAIVMLNRWLLLFHRHSQLNQIATCPTGLIVDERMYYV